MNADHLTTTTAAQKDEMEIIVKQIDRTDSICFCLVLTLPPQDKLNKISLQNDFKNAPRKIEPWDVCKIESGRPTG